MLFLIFSCAKRDEISFKKYLTPEVLDSSEFKEGKWELKGRSYIYLVVPKDDAYEEITVYGKNLELLFKENSIKGSLVVDSIRIGRNSVTGQGEEYQGFVVGEKIDITGASYNSTVDLQLKKENFILNSRLGIYDSEVLFDNDKIDEVTLNGVAQSGDVSGSLYISIEHIESVDMKSFPYYKSLFIKEYKEPFFKEGNYLGSLALYKTPQINIIDGDYYESNFDVELSFVNGKITGNAEYTSGYLGTISDDQAEILSGEIFEVSGFYTGGFYSIVLKSSELSYDIDILGGVTDIRGLIDGKYLNLDTDYGFMYSNKEFKASEIELEIEHEDYVR